MRLYVYYLFIYLFVADVVLFALSPSFSLCLSLCLCLSVCLYACVLKESIVSMGASNSVFVALCNIVKSFCTHSFELSVIIFAGVVAYVICMRFMDPVCMKLLERRICGVDINKTTLEKRRKIAEKPLKALGEEERRLVVPESLGILAGAVYLCVLVLELAIVFGPSMHKLDGAITAITVMLLLGFVDDVLDVRWRHKLLLSAIGTFPVMLTYDGSVSIAVPRPLLPYFSTSFVYLGVFYLLYLGLLCIFCTNSINILAGVNGVEVAQSIVIAFTCVVYNIFQLRLEMEFQDGLIASGDMYVHKIETDGGGSMHELMAIALLAPFIGVSIALWHYNQYPARIFVGDSYTYFAGTVLAVAGVTGQYGKTLMLFFIPQLINFALSLPQLFHFLPCPRHRVPRWNAKQDVLQNSGNYTLLNAILWIYGDMHERALTNAVMKMQVCCCIFGLLVRYLFASYLYDHIQ
ncbi:UDP-N-acetylglucosamine--dolichyl-phosphate n- acetylglucosaminephosphotransferase, putative [Trypanosoma cruzi]|uniref:UDP-N-acetylglucosamine--dolichyl-phosphate N-acetylglucosaminephosphotransferase n=2 Tax=Trypanosoma cruzi TaxID=5693 RepID=Q4DDP6_TRYCC|nr:UDP-N-acetylglucosamine--dolichyl-phosphate n- acetylglucosaminephosphotransferase, putative [Trypanosoma cruzi]EAN90658.1 UDP-N-acetylglucosamine--dolichyl-phosphate n- acetylglucosaminephosphotransferase, putative [Trypanosoma cruzi]|eukprot:XP_812509.1 UDP-N-acetylglucosamine--dolichyl-phosphate n- acetylglucosaminephosphotransferase [Trypanosoma